MGDWVSEANQQGKRILAKLSGPAAAESPERVLELWPKESDLIPGRRQFR